MSPANSINTQRALRLGCIADDFTGATDLAINLVQGGMRVVQTIGVGRADYKRCRCRRCSPQDQNTANK